GGNNTWSGNIILNTASALGVDAGTTLTQTTGAISGPGDLTKVGAGTLVLNAVNTYTGNTIVGTATVNGGILNVQNGLALGQASAAGGGTVTVNTTATTGSTLQVQGGIT